MFCVVCDGPGSPMSVFSDDKPLTGKSLGIIGMPGAGKTQFLRKLQGRPYTKYEQTSGAEDYEPFDFCHKGKTIRFQKGKDIGGNVENIKQYYDDFLNTKDICIFIFDINKYIDQTNYRNEVNSRLYFINRHLLSLDNWALYFQDRSAIISSPTSSSERSGEGEVGDEMR